MAKAKPKRIQRRRTKGWRKPENAVCVTRPGIFGNPFSRKLPRKEQVRLYRLFRWGRWKALRAAGCGDLGILALQALRITVIKRLPELAGRDLACFCPLDVECHGDILLEWARKGPI